MGKPTGFLEYKRETARVLPPKVRIANFNEFRTPLSKEKQKTQGARCMACGVPFCRNCKIFYFITLTQISKIFKHFRFCSV